MTPVCVFCSCCHTGRYHPNTYICFVPNFFQKMDLRPFLVLYKNFYLQKALLIIIFRPLTHCHWSTISCQLREAGRRWPGLVRLGATDLMAYYTRASKWLSGAAGIHRITPSGTSPGACQGMSSFFLQNTLKLFPNRSWRGRKYLPQWHGVIALTHDFYLTLYSAFLNWLLRSFEWASLSS